MIHCSADGGGFCACAGDADDDDVDWTGSMCAAPLNQEHHRGGVKRDSLQKKRIFYERQSQSASCTRADGPARPVYSCRQILF